MPYLAPADLRLVLAGTENATGTAAGLSDSDLNDAIDEAQSEVDGRLASHYSTPFDDPPTVVINITRDIAAYLATLTYRRGEPIGPTEPVQLRYNRAQKLLTDAASGAMPLPSPSGSPGDEEASTAEIVVINPTDTATWTPADFGLAARAGRIDSLTTTPWLWP